MTTATTWVGDTELPSLLYSTLQVQLEKDQTKSELLVLISRFLVSPYVEELLSVEPFAFVNCQVKEVYGI